MSSIFTQNIKTKFIDEFINDVANTSSNYYLAFGKPDAWYDSQNTFISDSNPPPANASITTSFYQVQKNVQFGKKISVSDIAYMTQNYTWTSNTVYDYYSDADAQLYSKQFYVVNKYGYVYKCLFNNYGAPSTVMPSSTSKIGDFKTADGYIWKYMFYISTKDQKKFSTVDYIPVQNDTQVANLAISGGIHVVVVDSSANGYPNANGFVASYQSSPSIIQIQNTNSSSISGEYNASAIYINSGTGVGTYANITNYVVNTSGKFVYASTPTLDPTSHYIIAPYVYINGDGSGAQALAIVNNYTTQIDSVQMIDRGINYTVADVSFVSNSIFTSGTSQGRAIISPPNGHGSNARYELGCDTVGISVAVQSSDNFPVDAVYRQIALLHNPLATANNELYKDFTFSQLTKINIGNFLSPFQPGETVVGFLSGATATVLFGSTTQLAVFNVVGQFQNNELLTGTFTGSTCSVASVVINDLVINSGEVFYYRNFEPIQRDPNSLEQIKLFFKV